MVSTRSHPSNFPPPTTESPSKAVVSTQRDKRSSSPAPSTSSAKARKPRSKQTSKTGSGQWTHTPSNLTLIWLVISVPLVVWDASYVLLRPYSMPGGSLHWPVWVPYKLYGEVDHVYGFQAMEAKNGFTAGQTMLNVVETIGYMTYLWIVWKYGRATEDVEGTGAPSFKSVGWVGEARSVSGSEGGLAVLVAFSMAVMTLSKTALYWLTEYFSGFHNIGHNDAVSLLFLWVIPNGLWIVFPAYIAYVAGQEILEGLAVASGDAGSTSSVARILAIKDE
ncbi:hypothetical protein MMC13_006952 [Lambiella insularis]|nr:hypothetical protein [Lambiella insularis]